MSKNEFIEYKGYKGSVCFDQKEVIFYGKIEFIRDLVSYEADNGASLIKAFKEAVDGYLEDCKLLNKTPDAPFKGSFNVRVPPELHERAYLDAIKKKTSLNNLVRMALEHELQRN